VPALVPLKGQMMGQMMEHVKGRKKERGRGMVLVIGSPVRQQEQESI
jgi:hypothetical protein